jgi:uncharacterized membrane protein
MKRIAAVAVAVATVLARSAVAQTAPLVCYGTEPAWTLDLGEAAARLSVRGEEDVEYRGRSTSLDRLKSQAWRGRSGEGGGDLVAFVSEAACSDGATDARRPFTARVSLPDGRLLAGCCRPATLVAGAPSGAVEAQAPPAALGTTTGPAKPPAAEDAPADWADRLEEFLPAVRSCTFEALRTEAVVFAEHRPNKNIHLVLRIPDRRYADCEAPPYGPARVIPRAKNSKLKPAEQTAVLTLLPGSPPRGSCDRTEPALDDKGNPFGWLTRKTC